MSGYSWTGKMTHSLTKYCGITYTFILSQANVNAENNLSTTPFMMATINKHTEVRLTELSIVILSVKYHRLLSS